MQQSFILCICTFFVHLLHFASFTLLKRRRLACCLPFLVKIDRGSFPWMKGVEAQTLANVYLALESNLEIVPVLNKIDLPGADPDRVAKEIEEVCTHVASANTSVVSLTFLIKILSTMLPAGW
ncbi:unnamed protein product [Calypogeia fissa]